MSAEKDIAGMTAGCAFGMAYLCAVLALNKPELLVLALVLGLGGVWLLEESQ